MIHFSERIKIVNDYYNWLDNASDKLNEPGKRIADSPISFLEFLVEIGILDEYDVHDYIKHSRENK